MAVLKLQAVLIDMDGTLLDSEKVWDVVLHDLAAELGGVLDAETRNSMVGSSMARTIQIMHDTVGVERDPATSERFLNDRTAELFHTGLVWKPGAEDLLVALGAAGIPTALVTATERGLTEIALDTLGRHHFAVTVCGDEVTKSKPAPDPYLRAAALCGAAPTRCVALEDSPLGIASAEAAGCAVLAVPSEVEVSPAASTTVRDSLVGITVDDLDALVRG